MKMRSCIPEPCRCLDKYTRQLKYLYVKGYLNALRCYSTWNVHLSDVCNRFLPLGAATILEHLFQMLQAKLVI